MGRAERARERLTATARHLPGLDRLLEPFKQDVDYWSEKLTASLKQFVALERQKFTAPASALNPALLDRRVGRERERLGHIWARAVSPQRRLDLQKARLAEVSEWLGDARTVRLASARDKLDQWRNRLRPALVGERISQRRQRLDGIARVMASLNPDNLLAKGYAMVLRRDSAKPGVVTSADEARAAAGLRLRFADGAVDVDVVGEDGIPPPSSSKMLPPKAPSRAPSRPSTFRQAQDSGLAGEEKGARPRQGGLFD